MGSNIWDFWAARYEGLWAQRFSLRPSRELVHRHLDQAAPGSRRFLDFGCGIGQFARELAERRGEAQVLAVDPSAAMIERARSDYAHPRVRHLHGGLAQFDGVDERIDGRFDVITCMHALPYVADASGVIKRLASMLVEGGRLLVIQGNTENPYDWLFFLGVKLTTTSSHYRSASQLQGLYEGAGLTAGVVLPIETAFFIPSIQLVEGVRP